MQAEFPISLVRRAGGGPMGTKVALAAGGAGRQSRNRVRPQRPPLRWWPDQCLGRSGCSLHWKLKNWFSDHACRPCCRTSAPVSRDSAHHVSGSGGPPGVARAGGALGRRGQAEGYRWTLGGPARVLPRPAADESGDVATERDRVAPMAARSRSGADDRTRSKKGPRGPRLRARSASPTARGRRGRPAVSRPGGRGRVGRLHALADGRASTGAVAGHEDRLGGPRPEIVRHVTLIGQWGAIGGCTPNGRMPKSQRPACMHRGRGPRSGTQPAGRYPARPARS